MRTGSNTSLNRARIATPETKLATAMMAKLMNSAVPSAMSGLGGKSIRRNLKNGMVTINSITVRKMNPLIHLDK